MRLLAGAPGNNPGHVAVNARGDVAERGHLNIGVVVQHLLVVLQAHKRQPSRQHTVHHDAERKNISLRTHLHLRVQHLRSHVGGGAHGGAGIHLIIAARQTEVRQLHLAVGVQQNIARFNIAV